MASPVKRISSRNAGTDKRAAILRAATRVIARNGYFNSKVADIARAADVEPEHVQAADAQDAAANDVAPRLDAVEISEAANDLRKDSTTAVVSFGRTEIERYGERNLVDLLSRLPGVSVDRAGGTGAEVRLQGLGAGYTQILINGERAPIGFTLDSLSPEVVERIEVMRSATADLGTQAIAGTINIVLRKVPSQDQREVVVNLEQVVFVELRGDAAGGGLRGRDAVGEFAAGERRPSERCHLARHREVEHAVKRGFDVQGGEFRLQRREREAEELLKQQRLAGVVVRDADFANFALGAQPSECLSKFAGVRQDIRAVDLEEVDRVGLEAGERVFAGARDRGRGTARRPCASAPCRRRRSGTT